MPYTGQKPGPGSYQCKGCDEFMLLTNNDDELPPCPYCKSGDYFTIDTPDSVTESPFHSGYF